MLINPDATNRTATPADFQLWKHRARGMSIETLRHATRDCMEAADCADSMGKHRASVRYLDEASTYMQELKTRRAA